MKLSNISRSISNNISRNISHKPHEYPAALLGEALPDLPDVIIWFMSGESNCGGFALNTELSAGELASRSVQILNNTNSTFESLDIGTNNITDHVGLSAASTHGVEASLANLFDEGQLSDLPFRIVKTGQGGMQLAQFGVGGTYWNKMAARKADCDAEFTGQNILYLFTWVQGINDALGNSSAALSASDWKAQTIAKFAELRTLFGSNLIIVSPQFPDQFIAGGQSSYSTALTEIAASDSKFFVTSSTSAEQRDSNHWSASGFKFIGPRIAGVQFSANAALRRYGPIIGIQPSDISVVENTSATFSVLAHSLGSVSYQWQVSTDGGAVWSNIIGATSTSYIRSTVLGDDGYKFRCRCSAYGYTRNSSVATLEVTAFVPFDPLTDLASLVQYYRADTNIFQDYSGGTTTPATANNDVVATWKSQVGSAYFSTASSTARPVISTRNGEKCVLSSQLNKLVLDAAQSIKCVFLVARHDGATTTWDFPCLFSASTSAEPTLIGGATGATTFLASSFLSTFSLSRNGLSNPSRNMPMNTIDLIVATRSTARSDTWQIFGHTSINDRGWRGELFAVGMMTEELTAGELSNLTAWKTNTFGDS